MANQADLFADARKNMVDSQIRPNRVTDPRILAAMRRLPRESFLLPAAQALAYADEDVPLGRGRFMMEPMVLAKLLQAAALVDQERVLVVGAGTGYGAAVVAACGCRVTALEDDPVLLEIARAVLSREAPEVTLIAGPLAGGCSANAPYDMILVEGAIPAVPPALVNQLHPETGRLLSVICDEDRATRAILAEVTAGRLGVSTIFDAGTPSIPSMRRTPSFQF